MPCSTGMEGAQGSVREFELCVFSVDPPMVWSLSVVQLFLGDDGDLAIVGEDAEPAAASVKAHRAAALGFGVAFQPRDQADPSLRLAAAAGDDGAKLLAADGLQLGERGRLDAPPVPDDPEKRRAFESTPPHAR